MKSKLNFFLLIIVCLLLISLPALALTSLNGYLWDKNSITCYLDPSIQNNFGSTIKSRVQSGISSYQGYGGPSINYVASYIGVNILVEAEDYGYTGWDGHCRYTSLGGAYLIGASIALNGNSFMDTYSTYPGVFQALACHEMGHAVGLGHNETSGESSIMKPYTTQFYQVGTSGPKLISPQAPDRTAYLSLYQ